MPLQWFPGHMTKAVRQIKENLGRADIVIEVLDARIPLSSRNPMIDDIVGRMPRLIVLNKADLADPNLLPQWEKALKADKENIQVVQISAKTGKNLPQLIEKAKMLCQKASWAGRRAVRAMVLGVPNVGKSAIINYLSGRRSRNVENRPGVTRDVSQSIKISATLKVIDTPGILWHKFEDQGVGEKLAILGSINDEILFREDIAVKGLEYFYQNYPKKLQDFGLTPNQVLAVVYSFSVIAGSCALMYWLMRGTVAILFFFAVWIFFGLLFVLLHKKYRAFRKRGASKS